MWNYLMSVLIFYIIIKASVNTCKVILNNNGRLNKIKAFNKNKGGLTPSILVTACVPFFRLIVILMMYYICFCSEEQFNKIIKD